jgi:hypothetical protein
MLVDGRVGRLLPEQPFLVQRRRLHDQDVAARVLHDVPGDRSQQLPLLGAELSPSSPMVVR